MYYDTYYIRQVGYEGAFPDIPERATIDDIGWFCDEYGHNFDWILEHVFEVDYRSNVEIMRDSTRTAKDIVLEMNNYLAKFYGKWESVNYDDVYTGLEKILKGLTAKELFEVDDYMKVWFALQTAEYTAKGNIELVREMKERRTVIEDELYEEIEDAVREETA